MEKKDYSLIRFGATFNRLTVLYALYEGRPPSLTRHRCRCVCGKETIVRADRLLGGETISCGCYGREQQLKAATKHGSCYTLLYRTWSSIITRCEKKTAKDYHRYGGKGIAMCPQWRNDFAVFEQYVLSELGGKPSKAHSLDRIDGTKGYEPGNLRWATPKEQQRNRDKTIFVTYLNEKKPLAEWTDLLKLNYSRTYTRIMTHGWSPEKAFTTPKVKEKRKLTLNGETLFIAEWSSRTGIPGETLRSRVAKLGWSDERALTTQVILSSA